MLHFVHSLPRHLQSSWFTLIQKGCIVHGILKKTINHLPLTINKRQRRFGFTLIELLVVMVVISTIAGAILSSTGNASDKAEDARRKADLTAIKTALVAYYLDNHHYPPSFDNATVTHLSVGNDDWIPELTPYMQQLPKDPRQAKFFEGLAQNVQKTVTAFFTYLTTPTAANSKPQAGQVASSHTTPYICPTPPQPNRYCGTIIHDLDDGNKVTTNPPTSNIEINATDNSVGHPYKCDENRDSYMRFTDIQIPYGKTITSAKIIFTPRSDDNDAYAPTSDDNAVNATGPLSINTKFRGEKSLNAGPISTVSDWNSRSKTNNTVFWQDIPEWHPYPETINNLTTPNLKMIIAEITNQIGWDESPRAINIFWEINLMPSSCSPATYNGRVALSKEGASLGINTDDLDYDDPYQNPDTDLPNQAPILDITWADPLMISGPSSLNIGYSGTFTASGGDGSTYTWTSPGQPPTYSGTSYTVYFSSLDENAVIQVESGEQTVTRSIAVVQSGGGGDPGIGSNPDPSQCIQPFIYCYAVSPTRKKFVLWGQLKNSNDPETYNKTTATCTDNPPGYDNGIDTLNYCLKSPT